MLSFPLYALILFFTRLGLFHRLNQLLPAPLTRVLPAESLSIMSSHLSGVLNAAAIARPFLEEGVLSPIQVFTTLIFGYAISLPLRTLRHVLPSALGIYPGRTGLKIAAYTQGFKLVLAVASTVIFLPMGVTR